MTGVHLFVYHKSYKTLIHTAMLFEVWIILNLIFGNSIKLIVQGSFVTGSSSSIAVLPTSLFPTEAASNLPLNGTISTGMVDCGWIYAAAGSTSPGYYNAAVFGTFNVGSGNTGQANVGYNNIGFANYGYSNTGRLNTGTQNIGYLNNGINNTGALNTGIGQIGDGNTNSSPSSELNRCIGYNNVDCFAVMGASTTQTEYSIGSSLEGSFLFGFDLEGTSQIGDENEGTNNVGFQIDNTAAVIPVGSIGVLNIGDALVGYNNTGNTTIGQNNTGAYQIGLTNEGIYQIGVNNTGTDTTPTSTELNIGIDQVGFQDIGVNNDGNDLTGFGLTGSSQIGGTYIDTSSLALSAPILFDVPGINDNIGSSYNSLPTVETQSGALYPFIQDITAVWKFNLDLPAVLSVVDLGCAGDIIQVYDWNALILTTSFPIPGSSTASLSTCAGLNDPDEALADSTYSRGFLTLYPGLHLLTFGLASGSVSSGSLLAFRIDLIRPPQPCTECTLPVPPLDPLSNRELFIGRGEFELPRTIFSKMDAQCTKDKDLEQIESLLSSSNNSTESTYNSSSSSSSSFESSSNTTSTSTSTSNSNSNSTSNSIATPFASTPPSPLNWCKSKNFKMLPNTLLTYQESIEMCSFGLARPSTPGAQLEITSLLFQCPIKEVNQSVEVARGQWIGSNWTGSPGTCLFASGETVKVSQDCNLPRRFICANN